MTNKYLPKFPLHNDPTLKGYEVSKIIHNVSRETSKINPVCIVTAILFAVGLVYLFIR